MARSRWLSVAICLAALCGYPALVNAQQARTPGVLVFSPNKCPQEAKALALIDSLAAPIFDRLVADGKLMSWGVLEHAWGDEWNVVMYYTASDIQAFHAAFNEAMRQMAQRNPKFMEAVQSLCPEHKDNIYAVRRMRSSPTP